MRGAAEARKTYQSRKNRRREQGFRLNIGGLIRDSKTKTLPARTEERARKRKGEAPREVEKPTSDVLVVRTHRDVTPKELGLHQP